MIYKFRSDAGADIIMMGPDGDKVLRLIGKEPAARGIIEVDAMPAAIAAMERAILTEKAVDVEPDGEADDRASGQAAAKAVRLQQRAWPLLEMMKRALAAEKDIVWGV